MKKREEFKKDESEKIRKENMYLQNEKWKFPIMYLQNKTKNEYCIDNG